MESLKLIGIGILSIGLTVGVIAGVMYVGALDQREKTQREICAARDMPAMEDQKGNIYCVESSFKATDVINGTD